MGQQCCRQEDEESQNSRVLERLLLGEQKKYNRTIKVLLIGAGNSGKSTVAKQLQIIYSDGFDREGRKQWQPIVFGNLLEAFACVLAAMEREELNFADPGLKKYKFLLSQQRELGQDEAFPVEYLVAMRSVWADPVFHEMVMQGNEFGLHDNLEYFVDSFDRLFDKSYVPSETDILMCRLKSSGVKQYDFEINNLIVKLIDVGGQRSERKRWIHCFEDVSAVLFLVALSGYNSCLLEDPESNQMEDAMAIFEMICNSKWFMDTSMIIFFNKIDRFVQQLERFPIEAYFDEFEPPERAFTSRDEYLRKLDERGRTYFHDRFTQLCHNPEREIVWEHERGQDQLTAQYSHFTNATDTSLLKNIMTSVQDIILQRNVRNYLL